MVSDVSLNNLSERQVSHSFDLDVLGIAKSITGAVYTPEHFSTLFYNLAYTAYYEAGAQYNVMVYMYNLNVGHEAGFNEVMSHGSAEHHGTAYGILVYESGSFRNYGVGGGICTRLFPDGSTV